MKESYSIFKVFLGVDDKNIKEVEYWFMQLIYNVVFIVRQIKEFVVKRVCVGYKFILSGVGVGLVIGVFVQFFGVRGVVFSIKDSCNIDEFMKYIEGGDKKIKGGSGGGKKCFGKVNFKRWGGVFGIV